MKAALCFLSTVATAASAIVFNPKDGPGLEQIDHVILYSRVPQSSVAGTSVLIMVPISAGEQGVCEYLLYERVDVCD